VLQEILRFTNSSSAVSSLRRQSSSDDDDDDAAILAACLGVEAKASRVEGDQQTGSSIAPNGTNTNPDAAEAREAQVGIDSVEAEESAEKKTRKQ
jgi:hypothetical protein